MKIPVIILAFADYRTDKDTHLRELGAEQDGIVEGLQLAQKDGLCKIVQIADANAEKIIRAFDQANGAVVGFHFAGHANSYELMLREHTFSESFIEFLGRQRGLKMVFLNGCSTYKHAERLLREGIPIVIGTSQSIKDQMARAFAINFYRQLGAGKGIEASFNQYESIHKIANADLRGFHREDISVEPDSFPWKLYINQGAETLKEWSLSQAAGNPLFGLPEVPPTFDLPDQPFRYLYWFERKHAEVFFGRGYQIRALFDKVTDSHIPPIILLYGQSGVGKSSLLAAGLTPRIEENYKVLYIRRDTTLGLAGSFKKGLCIAGPDLSPRDSWFQIENFTEKPLVLILDQLEEVFTNPLDSYESPEDELNELFAILKDIFAKPDARPNGKIVLSYRKEYHPEISKQCSSRQLAKTNVFLEPLKRADIIEAINGLSRNERTQKQYNLRVEEGLAEIIADDLIEDKNSAVAPVLQILLTKMWEVAMANNEANPIFTKELYHSLKREGILLVDFLRQKIEELAEWNREVVESGLVLDILMFHTSPKNTAYTHEVNKLKQRYAHRGEILEDLIREFKKTYLLIEPSSPSQEQNKSLRLTHDTLAPLVREMYEVSDKPGQMASRILRNKVLDGTNEATQVLLDEIELNIVSKGKNGMRVWIVDEEELVRASQEQQEKNRRFRRRLRLISIAATILIATFAIISTFLWQTAENRKKEAESNYHASQAFLALRDEQNPTKSFTLAQKAWEIQPSDFARSALYNAYYSQVFNMNDQTYTTPFYTPLDSFPQQLYHINFSSNNKYFAVASGDSQVRIFSAETGKLEKQFNHPFYLVRTVDFSHDDAYLMSAGGKWVVVWNYDGEVLAEIELEREVRAAIFSHDPSKILISSSNQTAWLLDWITQDTITIFDGHTQEVNKCNFSPDGQLLITAGGDGIAKIWNIQGEELAASKDMGPLYAAEFSPTYNTQEGGWVLAASADKNIYLWNPQTETYLTLSGHTARVYEASFAPSGKYIISTSEDRSVKIWDLNGKLITSLIGHLDAVRSACFSPDEKFVISASYDRTLKIWDLKGNPILSFRGHKKGLTSIDFSPDGSRILTVSRDQTVKVWSLNGEELFTIDQHTNNVNSASFSLDNEGKYILTSSSDRTARVWTKDGTVHLPPIEHETHVTSGAIAKDAAYIATGNRVGQIFLWDSQGKLLNTFEADSAVNTNRLIFSSDNHFLASSNRSGVAYLWELSGERKLAFTDHADWISDIEFSPDQRFLGTSSYDGTARIWNLQGETEVILSGHVDIITDLDFSPTTGDYMITASRDGTVRFWNRKGEDLFSLGILPQPVEALAFSPNGNHIATASWNSMANLWLINPDSLIEQRNIRAKAFRFKELQR